MTPFTKQQLFTVRNEIDIDWLISDRLYLERQFNGMWRFRCPLCQQFNTATQKKTNLGRCFTCQQNFNTIDLVMKVRGYGFKDSVLFLKNLIGIVPIQGPSPSIAKLAAGIGRPMP